MAAVENVEEEEVNEVEQAHIKAHKRSTWVDREEAQKKKQDPKLADKIQRH